MHRQVGQAGIATRPVKVSYRFVSNFLSKSPEAVWEVIQKRLDYDLRIDIEAKRVAVKKAWIAKDKDPEWVEYAVKKLPDASIDFEYSFN